MSTINEHLAMVSRTHRWLRRRTQRLLPKRRHLTAEERVEADELLALTRALHRELDCLITRALHRELDYLIESF